jgi:anti-sigma factor RsiW
MKPSDCTYTGDREEALIAYLYDDAEGDRAARTAFGSHVATCAQCDQEVASLRGVRAQLARWAPPEPSFAVTGHQSAIRNPHWWSAVPAWAQVAAALLFLGVSAGIANLDIKYDANGLSVRTGWVKPAASGAVSPGTAAQSDPAPWRSELTALERQLKTELRAVQMSSSATAPQVQPARVMSQADADVLRRVRALIDESEKRQQNELALRVAEMLRDVHAMRQADLVKIDRTLGEVRNDLGVQVMRDRQKLNTLLVRTGARQ